MNASLSQVANAFDGMMDACASSGHAVDRVELSYSPRANPLSPYRVRVELVGGRIVVGSARDFESAYCEATHKILDQRTIARRMLQRVRMFITIGRHG